MALKEKLLKSKRKTVYKDDPNFPVTYVPVQFEEGEAGETGLVKTEEELYEIQEEAFEEYLKEQAEKINTTLQERIKEITENLNGESASSTQEVNPTSEGDTSLNGSESQSENQSQQGNQEQQEEEQEQEQDQQENQSEQEQQQEDPKPEQKPPVTCTQNERDFLDAFYQLQEAGKLLGLVPTGDFISDTLMLNFEILPRQAIVTQIDTQKVLIEEANGTNSINYLFKDKLTEMITQLRNALADKGIINKKDDF